LNGDLRQTLAEETQNHSSTTKQRDELQQQLATLTSKHDHIRANLDIARRTIEDLRNERRANRATIGEFEEERKILEDEKQQFQRRIQELLKILNQD
jgi:chromosome segregation ATPase